MSCPAEKAGPFAASTTARTRLSAAISARLAVSAAISASDRLLRACGRLRTRTAMLSCVLAQQHGSRRGADRRVHGRELKLLSVACKRGTGPRGTAFSARGRVPTRFGYGQNCNEENRKGKPRQRNPMPAGPLTRRAALVEACDRDERCARSKRGVFSLRDPKKIAASLKRSAERSKRRKTNPYRSALSMLTFYINRAGKNLPARGARCSTAPRTS